MLEHPLFIQSEDDDPKDLPNIDHISVMRSVRGRWVAVPRSFNAEELQSPEDIAELLGGGSYKLFGRGKGNARIAKTVVIEVEGDPPEEIRARQSPPVPQAEPIRGGSDLAAMAQIMTTMMQGSQQQSREFMLAMNNANTASMNALATIIGGALKQTTGHDPAETFRAGVDAVKALQPPAAPPAPPPVPAEEKGEDWGAILGNIGKVAELVQMFMGQGMSINEAVTKGVTEVAQASAVE
jgi:hypothetical protein